MIRLENVSKFYSTSTRPALDDLSVEIDKGEFVFLIGPSGSGKSTFLQLLLREETPSKGDVYVGGRHLNKMSKWQVPKLRRTMGLRAAKFSDSIVSAGSQCAATIGVSSGRSGKCRSGCAAKQWRM